VRITRTQTLHLDCRVVDCDYSCDAAESIEATFEKEWDIQNHSPMTSEVTPNNGLEHLPSDGRMNDSVENCSVLLSLL
jgi:hypothetical protein